MKPTMRNYQTEEDYWCIREFLREVSMLNDRREFSWSLLRWDYWVWHVNMNIFHFNLEDVITLWEANGQIVAMLNPDGNSEVFFQIHPAYRSDVQRRVAGMKVCRYPFDNHRRTNASDRLATPRCP